MRKEGKMSHMKAQRVRKKEVKPQMNADKHGLKRMGEPLKTRKHTPFMIFVVKKSGAIA